MRVMVGEKEKERVEVKREDDGVREGQWLSARREGVCCVCGNEATVSLKKATVATRATANGPRRTRKIDEGASDRVDKYTHISGRGDSDQLPQLNRDDTQSPSLWGWGAVVCKLHSIFFPSFAPLSSAWAAARACEWRVRGMCLWHV